MICPACQKNNKIVKNETDEFGKNVIHFSCGHKFFKVFLKDSTRAIEMIGMKKKGKYNHSKKHKYDYESKIGERIGRDGNVAYIEQISDRKNKEKDGSYIKYVKSNGKVIKDSKERLLDHKH